MEQFKIPAGYHSDLNLHDTQVAIKTVKDFSADTCTEAESPARIRSGICSAVFRSE